MWKILVFILPVVPDGTTLEIPIAARTPAYEFETLVVTEEGCNKLLQAKALGTFIIDLDKERWQFVCRQEANP